jgi:hypothetical protein
MGFKSHIWKKKKNIESHPGLGLTRRVDRVWLGRCTDRSFDKPGPVQPPDRPGPGSTRRAGPGLITMILSYIIFFLLQELYKLYLKFLIV